MELENNAKEFKRIIKQLRGRRDQASLTEVSMVKERLN